MKNDFEPYKVGTVFNPMKINFENIKLLFKSIEINYPSRLDAMAIDPSKIASNNNMVYSPGEIVFSIKLFHKIKIEISKDLIITENSKRKSLIKHSFLLMKNALGFKENMTIDIDNKNEIKHAGLGSSGCLIAGVASAINELYGKPINHLNLIKYLAQNHGEEIENNEEFINPVQCIGGSASSGNVKGGMIMILGESCIAKTMNINKDYDVIIGIPKDFKPLDSKTALEEELKNIDGFIQCGKKYGQQIAYNILHSMLPAMVNNDISIIGDVIYDYRFNMGSIKNCSFLYPKLIDITNNLSFLKKNKIADVLAISSVGPGIFAITKNKDECLKAFKNENLKVYLTKINNKGYKVIKKVAL